jgi:1,5-anhydro-D-fructose reductase (1,5-anhydro-D-mannitol-forming)
MINCGIIGFGKMGKIRAKAIEASGLGCVSYIYDIDAKKNFDYNIVDSPNHILEDIKIDAIFVCTPNYLIPRYCIDALKAGKHVFSEKPPGFNSKVVSSIIKAEKNAPNLKLMFGFNHRHHESMLLIKKIIVSGELGKILWIRGRYGKEVDQSFFGGWRAKKELAGGGILLDQGIHMVDLMLDLVGDFDQVHAFVSNLYWKIDGIEDNVFAIFRNSSNGISASLHSTMTQWRYLFSFEIFLEGGSLILNGLKTSSGSYGDEVLTIKRNNSHSEGGKLKAEEQIVYHTDNSWLAEINYFFDAILNNQSIHIGNSQDAYKLMKLIDDIYKKGK